MTKHKVGEESGGLIANKAFSLIEIVIGFGFHIFTPPSFDVTNNRLQRTRREEFSKIRSGLKSNFKDSRQTTR